MRQNYISYLNVLRRRATFTYRTGIYNVETQHNNVALCGEEKEAWLNETTTV